MAGIVGEGLGLGCDLPFKGSVKTLDSNHFMLPFKHSKYTCVFWKSMYWSFQGM